MSKIEKLIKEKCPNGVEYICLGEILNYTQPTKYIVNSTDYDNNYKIPVLTAGQSFILGYTDETENIYNASSENPVIIFDDFTTSNHWVNFNFKVKSSALKILTLINNKKFNFKYVYYCIKNINYTSKEHSRQWIQTYSNFKIPVPPTEVQQGIVKILDKFSELEAELEAELEERKQQYEFWRGRLLNKNIDNKTLFENICNNIFSGKCNNRLENGEYPVYGSTGVISSTDKYAYSKEQILIARVGANAGYVHIAHGKYDVSDNTIIIDLKENIDMKYIFYYLENMKLNNITRGGGQPLITASQIKQLELNLPSLKDQKRISSILGNFDKLINDISEGIPAEIELRKQQYEYYRNKLLSFEELV